MRKLIVKTPAGNIEQIEVGEGGGYFDPALVLRDEAGGKPMNADQQAALDAWQLQGRKDKARAARNALLRSNIDAMGVIRWELMSAAKKLEWRTFRQALLDVPQQAGFPDAINWPVVPVDA